MKYVIVYQEILFHMRSLTDAAKQCGFEVIAYFDEWYEWVNMGEISYLLRENKWFNYAGFSTKIGESLEVGTPMFANCTSDIGYYIKDLTALLLRMCPKELYMPDCIRFLDLVKSNV